MVSSVPAIEVENLHKSYGDLKAVDGLSLDVEEGEVFGLLGPNGAGKTTTVEILIGLRQRDSGSVRVMGFDPAQEGDAVKTQIGVQLAANAALPAAQRRGDIETLCQLLQQQRVD